MGKMDRAVLFKQLERLYRDGTSTAQTDTQLLDRFLSYRDEAAFEAIVSLHGPMVLALCRRFLRDPRDIEDAFQATFLILARKAGSIRNRQVLSSWLYGVAYRVAVRARSDLLKRKSIEIGVPLLDDLPSVPMQDADEVGPLLDQELSRLPEKYRAPIVLCYLKEQTHDQAAAALRWPVGTVRSRLARGREMLRDRLTRRGCAPASVFLGMGSGGSWQAFTAAVPQPLVEATVAAAGRFLAGAAVAAPAALTLSSTLSGSASTLAQGVLTTMALTQIKLIGAGVAAAGVLLGGAGAGAWALGAGGRRSQDEKPPAAQDVAPRQSSKPAGLPSPAAEIPPMAPPGPGPTNVESRLAELERKLDMMLKLMQQNRDLAPGRGNPQQSRPEMPPPVAPRESDLVPTSSDPPPPLDQQAQRSAKLPPPRPEGPAQERPPVGDLSPFEMEPGPQPEPPRPANPQQLPQLTPDSQPSLQPMNPNQGNPNSQQGQQGLPQRPGQSANQGNSQRQNQPEDNQSISQSQQGRQPGLDNAQPQNTQQVNQPSPLPQPELGFPINPPRFSRLERDPFDTRATPRSSLKEIQAQIKIALLQYERNKALFQSGVIPKERYDEPLEQLRLLLGRLEGWDDELAEDSELLKLEMMKKNAEIQMAEAQLIGTSATVARNKRINERKKGMVSAEDVAKANSEDAAASASVQVKQAEAKEVELKQTQLNRRRAQIMNCVAWIRKSIPELGKGTSPF